MRLLGQHGVLRPDLVGRMAQAMWFRAVLVHCYARVDDDLSDLTGFAKAVSIVVQP